MLKRFLLLLALSLPFSCADVPDDSDSGDAAELDAAPDLQVITSALLPIAPIVVTERANGPADYTVSPIKFMRQGTGDGSTVDYQAGYFAGANWVGDNNVYANKTALVPGPCAQWFSTSQKCAGVVYDCPGQLTSTTPLTASDTSATMYGPGNAWGTGASASFNATPARSWYPVAMTAYAQPNGSASLSCRFTALAYFRLTRK